MFNVLIVDDFKIDRENLRNILLSLENKDINVIGECEDGKQALQFIRENRVDIVISDIDMPFVNGLELAKNLNKNFPSIKIIFCSLYDEFEYARKALYLDTYGYILKPIDTNELVTCLTNVVLEIENEEGFRKNYEEIKKILEENKPQLLDNFIKEIINGLIYDETEIWNKAEYLGVELKDKFFGLVYIEIDDYQRITENRTVEQKQLFAITVYKRLQELAKDFGNGLITRMDDSHFIYIENNPLKNKAYLKCAEFADIIINAFEDSDISVTLSISDVCNDIKDIKNLLEQCVYIMRYKFTLGSGKVLKSEDIPADTYNRDIDLNTMQKDIRFLLNSGSEKNIQEYIEQLLVGTSKHMGQNQIIQICFSVITCMSVVLNENGQKANPIFRDVCLLWERLIEFETSQDVGSWIESILISANKQLLYQQSTRYEHIIDSVKEFINENYMQNIGIEDIAKEVNYSTSYLSYVFKKNTGETIMDYITNLKIEKAKEMLTDLHYKIYNISDALGFSNAAYFCSVFKKNMAMTPNEYRVKIGLINK